jgi:hypothetical protein
MSSGTSLPHGLTPAIPTRTVLRLAKAWDLAAVAVGRVTWVKVVDQRIRVVTGVADAAGSEPGIAQPW